MYLKPSKMSSQEGLKPAKLNFEHYIPVECDLSLPPLLFVHGITDTHTSWSKVLKEIAKNTRRQAYAPDLRSHGESEWNDCFTLDALTADLGNFLLEHGINKCVWIGHSLGGKIGISFALTKPDFIEKIVVEEMGVSNFSEDHVQKGASVLAQAKRINMLPAGMSEAQIRQLIIKVAKQYHSDLPVLDTLYYIPLRKESDGSFRLNFHVDAVEKHIRDGSVFTIDFDKCRPFPGPTLFLRADSSQMILDKDEELKKFFPDARFGYFKKAAHSLHAICPEEFIDKVTNFIHILDVAVTDMH